MPDVRDHVLVRADDVGIMPASVGDAQVRGGRLDQARVLSAAVKHNDSATLTANVPTPDTGWQNATVHVFLVTGFLRVRIATIPLIAYGQGTHVLANFAHGTGAGQSVEIDVTDCPASAVVPPLQLVLRSWNG